MYFTHIHNKHIAICRLKHADYMVTRYPAEIGRYKMLTHGQEKGNKENKKRYAFKTNLQT